MNHLNQALIEGKCVGSVETEELSGVRHVTVRLSVERNLKDDGKETSIFDVEMYGAMAEKVAPKCKNGCELRIVGRLKQNKWTGDDGKCHSKVCIIAEHVEVMQIKYMHDSEF